MPRCGGGRPRRVGRQRNVLDGRPGHLDVTVHTCNGNFQPTTVAACLDDAANQGAAAVITAYVDYKTSRLMSDAVIADSGGKASVLAIRLTDSAATIGSADRGVAELRQRCPACTVYTQDTSTAHLSTLASSVSAQLTRHPDLNYIVGLDDNVSAITAGISNAGLTGKVKIVSKEGEAAVMQRVASGNSNIADVGFSAVSYGWSFADALVRLVSGDPIGQGSALVRVFDHGSTAGLTITPAKYATLSWYDTSGFEDAYLTAWGSADMGPVPVSVQPRLSAERVSKTFGPVRVLDADRLTVRRGEVHGLIGENGSGKCTLVKVLTGYHAPDPGGTVRVGGRPLRLPVRWADARAAGISVVHQDLGLVDHLTVAENICVGGYRRSRWLRRIDWRHSREVATQLLSRLRVDADPDAPAGSLPAGARAGVAIARALRDHVPGSGLIILDEATRLLAGEDLRRFHRMLRDLAGDGTSVLMVSHNLEEVLAVTDRVTVLRDGRVSGAALATASLTGAELARRMLGTTVSAVTPRRAVRRREAAVVTGRHGEGVAGLDPAQDGTGARLQLRTCDLVLVASDGGFDPTASVNYLLPALAATFLGTAVVQPGQFNPIGSLIGIYFLETGIFGLQLFGYSGWIQDVFYGGGLVAAVAVATVVRQRAAVQPPPGQCHPTDLEVP